MIYYEIDPVVDPLQGRLSDSISKSSKDFTINSRIENILKSNKPSEVVYFCSQFKNNFNLPKSYGNEYDPKSTNEPNTIYNENDIVKIIDSLKLAETNFLFEKEIDSVVNYFVMKEINPTQIENKKIPNLRLLKTDPLFRSYVDAKLLNYKPIQFDLINFYISKHDIGVQSPSKFSKKTKNLKNNNNSDDISNKPSISQQNIMQASDFSIRNDYISSTPQTKQTFIFLSDSDTENNNKSQDLTQSGRKLKQSKNEEYDVDSAIYSSYSRSCSNYYSEAQSESSKESSHRSKKRHKHHKHHNSNDSKSHKHHHSHHDKSILSKSDKLIEIEQESSSELKENRKKNAKLLHLGAEDSLNMIVDSSSNLESFKSNNDERVNANQKIFQKNSDSDVIDEDYFEIEFENKIEVNEEEEIE